MGLELSGEAFPLSNMTAGKKEVGNQAGIESQFEAVENPRYGSQPS